MKLALVMTPALLQAVAMAVDEGWFHRRRGLPPWERIGHPLDTLTVAACYGWLLTHGPGERALMVYAGLAVLSCLFVTKDSFVHARLCSGGETWVHSVLFVLHPMVLLAAAVVWWSDGPRFVLQSQLVLALTLALYQLAYWSVPWKRRPSGGVLGSGRALTGSRRRKGKAIDERDTWSRVSWLW
jgi:hypothetical protein